MQKIGQHGNFIKEAVILNRYLIVILLLVGVMFSMNACNKNNQSISQGYSIISGDDYNLNTEENGSINRDFVTNVQTAQSIGDAVIKSVVGEEKFKKLSKIFIFYDPKEKIWIINRALDENVLGGDYNCAISQSNGEILKVWAGE